MVSWFQKLNDKDKQNMTYISRLYSYHFDVYLNNIYRNKVFPRFQLFSHAKELIVDPGTHDMWINSMYTDVDFNNKYCSIDKSPFKDFIGKTTIKLSDYIETIKNITLNMHNVFTNPQLSYVLQNELIVYRALKIRKEKDIDIDIEKDVKLEITGTTSTSTALESAEHFAFSLYGESKYYDERKYKSLIFEITLPKGTRILPINICTIQDENEILVISQGNLKIDNVKLNSCNWWNDYINKDGKLIKKNEGVIPYKLAKVNFIINNEKKLDYNPTIKISEKYDDGIVIDDIGTSTDGKRSGRKKSKTRKSGRNKLGRKRNSKRKKSIKKSYRK